MWRFLSSITRGARSVRPSQCCSQDNLDESGNNFLQVPRTPQPPQCRDIVQPQCSPQDEQNHVMNGNCPLIKLSRCIYSQLSKQGLQKVDSSIIHPKFHWVWVYPCNVLPPIEDGKNEWERKKWERFYRRRQQILLSNTILNAVGWGSAAAFTWSVCQYLKTYSLLFHNNSQYNNSVISDTQYITAGTKSSKDSDVDETCFQNISNENIPVIDGSIYNHQLDCDLYHFNHFFSHKFSWAFNAVYKAINNINGWENISFKINGSIFHQPVLDTGQVQGHIEQNASEGNKDRFKIQCPEEPISQEISIDRKPQIETDRYFLEVRTDDSGFLESSGHDKDSSPDIKDEFTTDIQAADASNFGDFSTHQVDGTPSSFDVAYPKLDESLTESDNSVSATHTHQRYKSSVNAGTPERIVPEVIIEDCSDDDDDGLVSFSKTFERQNLPPKQNTNSLGIDEFSDGLKEILEAGRKDLNDFSTAFMGILEGDIGRTVAEKEPELAIPYFRAGALLGDVASTFNLAMCYHMAQGVEQDLKKARELYEAAHLGGHSWATYNLAVMLSQGEGGPADPQRAYRLLLQAAQQGVKEAEMGLQQMKLPQKESSPSDNKVLHALKEDRSLASVKSEPSFSSVVSNIWSSSYSTTDLDFMEESGDEMNNEFSAFSMNSTGKPVFYLESP